MDIYKDKNNCQKFYKQQSLKMKNFPVQFSTQSKQFGIFYFSSSDTRPVKITATLKAGSADIVAPKEVKVENSGVFKKDIVTDSSGLIYFPQNNRKFNLNILANKDSGRTIVNVHGNLLGPALNGLEHIL